MDTHYYVSQHANSNGDHEVHRKGCPYRPRGVEARLVGVFNCCGPALDAARQHYRQVNGCYHCAHHCYSVRSWRPLDRAMKWTRALDRIYGDGLSMPEAANREPALRRYNPVFRFEVALAALSGQETIARIATRFSVHPILVCTWKQELAEKLSEMSDAKTMSGSAPGETEVG
jgi:hypothetical protein